MKTLKKTLSLTLVFALVFSLMSFAFAAPTTTTAAKLSDFTDKDQLTYTEAADYLIAAGVVKGDTDTTLNPKGDLTREQAAKLIAYACLGQVAADNLKASVAPFNDVAADRWSAGYIAYCQKQGIINGYGDGTFNPTAKVTGYQYAKMLLCSIGYGVNGEFTGAGWSLEVAKLALSYGIFTGNTTGANSNAANREEAFLYTFNTLSSLRSVAYNKTLGIYYVPGSDAISTNPASQKADRSDTIGYQRFKMVLTAATAGAKGETRHYWAIDSKKVTGNYADKAVTVLAKSANGTAYGDLVSDSKTTYIGYSADSTVNYYYNGDKIVSTAASGATAAEVAASLAANVAAKTARVDVKGVTVSFIDTDKNGKYNTVFIEEPTLAKITAAPTVTTSGNVTLVTVPGITGLTEINADNVDGYTGLAKGDYVMYYKNADSTSYTIAKCDVKTGKIFGYNEQGNKLNFNGTNVDMTEIASADQVSEVVAADLVGVDNLSAYYDANGYMVKVVASEASTATSNFVYIKAVSDDTLGTAATALFSDGTATTINVAKVDGKVQKASARTFYTFTKDSAGAYSLTAISSANYAVATYTDAGATEVADILDPTTVYFIKGNSTVKGTSATEFIYEDYRHEGTYRHYTGLNNAPKVDEPASEDVVVKALYTKDGNYAKFVVATNVKIGASNKSDYLFVTLPVSVNAQKTDDKFQVYYKGVLNGEIKAEVNGTEGLTDGDGALDVGGLYEVIGYENGRVASVQAPSLGHTFTNTSGVATAFDYNNGTLEISKGSSLHDSISLASDCKIFLHDATKAEPTIVAVADAEELESYSTKRMYKVQALEKSLSDHSVTQLYITILPDTYYTGVYAVAATVDGVTATVTDNSDGTYSIAGATKGKAAVISVTTNNAALGLDAATVTYCLTEDGVYTTTQPALTTSTSGSTGVDMFFKVSYGGATSDAYKVTFTTEA